MLIGVALPSFFPLTVSHGRGEGVRAPQLVEIIDLLIGFPGQMHSGSFLMIQLMLTDESRIVRMNYHVCPTLDLHYADGAQHLETAGEKLFHPQ